MRKTGKAGTHGIHTHVPHPSNNRDLEMLGWGVLAKGVSSLVTPHGHSSQGSHYQKVLQLCCPFLLSQDPIPACQCHRGLRTPGDTACFRSLLSFTSWFTSVSASYYMICQLSITLSIDGSQPLRGYMSLPNSLQISLSSLSFSLSTHPANPI